LQHLFFGARARRRARFKRVLKRTLAWGAAVSVAALLLGVPGSDAGLRFVEDALSGGPTGVFLSTGIETSESAASTARFRRGLVGVRATLRSDDRAAAEASAEAPDAGNPMTELIYDAAAEFGVDGNFMYALALCESNLDPRAYNAAGYHGLFQFDRQTWAAFGEGDIYDPVSQARATARLIAAGETERWPNCP
jgi:soluble lytic murein transglycosylase-like protein